MSAVATDNPLVEAVALLGAAVLLVPLFRRLGLGSVLGYLVAGMLVGPYGLGWFTDPESILHLAELGVVMFLFVIGLEMQPSRLWCLRRYILGLGLLQTAASAAALTALGWLSGLPVRVAFIGALGFTLTSTAIVMQLMGERRDLSPTAGQKIVSVLLLEDLLLVPLLALVAWMAPVHAASASGPWLAVLKGVAAFVTLLVAGRWLLNPLFRVLAKSKVRELLSAGALLVVLGAALLMQVGGLSMAMGAFIAGVLLSESSFRHQLEADVEPFRGLLLGLFFLGVGMVLDLATVRAHWEYIVFGVVAMMALKGACIYVIARVTRSDHGEALQRASLMALGGEFAFVLFAAATEGEVLTASQNAIFTAAVVLSMVLSPLVDVVMRRLPARRAASVPEHADEAVPEGLNGSVLMIGFGRFGQVVSQPLLARDVDVTVIDTDIEMIQAASRFGFRIYYGDGTRLDVLEAAGAGRAQVIAVCVDRRETVNRILDVAMREYPDATWLVRTYDREHSREVVSRGVENHVRETFESALHFGTLALRRIGVSSREARRITDVVRARDATRFEQEIAGVDWATAGTSSFTRRSEPVPLTPPRHPSQALNQQAEVATRAKP
ncbi:monovalent cation:proton antiporter-2 (CPA2) family protein [Luteibacter sp. 3190]|uniref:monovalent cation:proton antiporter-2 (CPA2) family protein n=1 Tax=Luteibacter sp. 3190 TaxID=2817736 RepID=UPI00285B72DD|nr:monovalent cation:proton antiporter-2 (CPA2) family protein [Luteibacter sp. 3190]MDR6935649.1 glutathione-regulated potassium-efflux system protein KefB [Luteibacter sp. 3190]